jgi:alginate O-acetyltransferase complex protein AlgI
LSFVSIQFAVLCLSCLAIYPWLGRRAQNALILLTSYVFYGSWDYRFLGLLGATTAFDFFVVQRIEHARLAGNQQLSKRWLRASLASNLSVLGFFKYFGFFVHEARTALEGFGIHTDAPTLQIVLPVGISFYTFQSISYAVDVYRGDTRACRDFLDFATFIAFFPQLVAGPIERAHHMLGQFENPRRVTGVQVQDGLWLILIGFFRKVVVADTAASFASRLFNAPGGHTSAELACALVLFTVQIYGDFAGYSDIARGVAKLFGFELMRNFEHPYFAQNVAEFWRRWHISLSTWLRDYLYVPLGGNRKGAARTYLNLFITMLLGGLWHGASWNFVIWGALHGVYLGIHRALRPALDRLAARGAAWASALNAGGVLVTFALVAFTWLFFRSATFELTQQYLAGLFAGSWQWTPLVPIAAVLSALMLAIDLPQHLAEDETRVARLPRFLRIPIAACMWLLLFSSQDSGEPFIYFQF